ncbi:hypothetical protein GGR51DRAFT_531304 [Nemania sp. FL0031]|nr:hypothetical protein GGR51DRAFT_531304 [Nemania sp. FL0031]
MSEPADEATGGNTSALSYKFDNLFTTLDTAKERIEELESARSKAEKDLKQALEDYNQLASEEWELRNEYKDKSRELEILQLELQNSIPLADWKDPPLKLKTALEVGQQKVIKELQREKGDLQKENANLQKENAVLQGEIKSWMVSET